jgi:hypothetical protein
LYFRKIDDEELFGDFTNQLHFVDAVSGKEIFRSHDPLNKGKSVHRNDLYKGMSRYVAANENDLFYSTDHLNWKGMNMRRLI